MSEKENILSRTWMVVLLASICCILWGSAIPAIKTGYRLLEVESSDTASQIVFAGIRFALAGLLVLLFGTIREKKIMLPEKSMIRYIVPVCLAQTLVQYFFFYIGVAHTSGVKGGIITGTGSFIAILGFVNPLCSVILSALVLGEVQEAFNLYSLSALVMVCVGIYVVNFRKETGIS